MAEARGEEVPQWSYVGKKILAPMHGADIVYSEEIIDRKIISCSRSVNDALGTIDFTSKSGDLVFQTLLPTAAQAPEPVVFQVGTADSVLALQAATVVARDVRAIDVNMGCPVAFSTQGGMGSSLLIKPDTVRDILTTLRRNLDSTVPITCKIRLLRDERASVDLLKLIESCGVAAVGVHARHVSDRPRWRAMPEALVPVLDAANLGIPVIYNGDAFVHADLERLRLQTRTQAVMVARGAMWNPCVFEPHFSATIDMVDEYLKIAQQYRNKFSNSKYVVGEIVKHHVCSIDNKLFEAFSRAKDYEQLVQAAALARTPEHRIESLCAADPLAYAAALPAVGERPWHLDLTLEPLAEYDSNGCAMSVSNVGKKRHAAGSAKPRAPPPAPANALPLAPSSASDLADGEEAETDKAPRPHDESEQ